MISKVFSFHVLLLSASLLITIAGASLLNGSVLARAPQPTTDVRGTWSGTFFSRHSNVPPFTMTVVINPDLQGHLIGASTLKSQCMASARLEVTVTGSQVVLAGSDQRGDNLTVRGTVDNSGTLLNASYILNASAGGKCETDDGTGSLAKR